MSEAERMHSALRTMTENLCGVFEDARFERREGYDSAAPSLGAALGEIEQLGLPCSVQIRRGRTPEFEVEAKRLGLTAEEPIPGMIATSDAVRGAEIEDLEIVRVETADGLAQALAVAAAGFGAPADLLTPLYMLETAALEGLAYYLGRVDGRDVSTSVGYTRGDTVGVFNVATPIEHRGHGYGAALTAHAARDGFADGAELAWLQSSAMGLPVYRRLGFHEAEAYVLLTRPSSS
jgi:N-acetylglutamate synthase